MKMQVGIRTENMQIFVSRLHIILSVSMQQKYKKKKFFFSSSGCSHIGFLFSNEGGGGGKNKEGWFMMY